MSSAENHVQFAAAAAHAAHAERRDRRPVSLRGFIAVAGGAAEEAVILDLSYDGCAIETGLALESGQTVSLTVLRRGAIDAEVRWAADGKAGLAFKPEQPEQPIQTAQPPQPAQPDQSAQSAQRPRAAQRLAVTAEVVVRRRGQAKYRVHVLDLSPVGCKIDLIDRPSVGEQMLVKFDGLEIIVGDVIWVEAFCAGLRFTRPIHASVFDLFAARLQQNRER